MHERYLFSRELYEIEQEGVTLASVVRRRTSFAKVVAKTVARGEYVFAPARIRHVQVDGRKRRVYALRLSDLVVHRVVAEVIADAMAPALSATLYSYRPGVSWWAAVSDFAAYVREHRRARPNPKDRGLYVLRRDIDSYTDSIPVGAASPLWAMLQQVVAPAHTGPITPDAWSLIEHVVRPEAFGTDGQRFSLFCGVPTGQPISCVLFNLYLCAFDRQIAAIPGAFYARYCDDIRFAHPDAETVRAVDRQITERLAGLRLAANPRKSAELYLTGAGRRSAVWPETTPTNQVPFLGCRITASGTVSLSRRKVRGLFRDLGRRARQTARLSSSRSVDARGRRVCAVINQALNARTVFEQRSATLLRRAITDRRQLRQIDHWIARLVLDAVTGQSGVRAFRMVSYRTVRRDWRLISLLHARNRWPRR